MTETDSQSTVTIRPYGKSDYTERFASAVSLHSHTHHSREFLGDLPRYISRIPLLAAGFEWELRNMHRQGRTIDFSKGCWHPPVGARAVFESEADQIESRFGLSPLVSVTDHDDIRAGFDLQTLYANRRAPVSLEWTIPFDAGFFHLGVHNLPADEAQEWYERLSAFTSRAGPESLTDLLSDLNASADRLIVLCHPLWDLAGVGRSEHASSLRRFLASHQLHIHAIELNGYRSWQENVGARALALDLALPVISGGDRHGRAPNALLNLTAARTFAGFAAEIRDGASHVVVMPEYQQNLVARKLAAASDVLRTDPRQPKGRVHWTDRVTWERDGDARPLSSHWPDGGPWWVRSSVAAFQLIANPVMLPMIGAALNTVEGGKQP